MQSSTKVLGFPFFASISLILVKSLWISLYEGPVLSARCSSECTKLRLYRNKTKMVHFKCSPVWVFFLKTDVCATFPVVLEASTSRKANCPLHSCSCEKFIDLWMWFTTLKKDWASSSLENTKNTEQAYGTAEISGQFIFGIFKWWGGSLFLWLCKPHS